MKKGLLLLAILLCFTGCGKKDALEEATEKMNALENYQLTMNMTVGAKSEGIEMEIPFTMDMQVDVKNKITKMDFAVSLMGIKISTESYTDSRDENNSITYTRDLTTENWVKSVSKNSLTDIKNPTNNYVEPKEISSDDKVIKYEATILKDDLKDMLETTATNEETTTEYEIIKDAVATIEVDKESGYITKMYMDLTDCVNVSNETTELSKMTLEILFSKFNEVGEIKIDQEIIDNAVDEAMMEAMEYAQEYIYAIEWEVMYEGYTTYTNTDLEYDGPKPESVNVTIEDDYVKDGTIVINGYTVTIVDGEIQTPTLNAAEQA